MKRVFVGELSEGLKVDDVFLVASKTVARTKEGKPYLRLKLADRTGQVMAVKWNASDSELASFGENDFVRVNGSASTWNGELQITLDSFQKPSQPIDPADFIRISEHDPDDMLADLRLILGTITDPDLSRLLDAFFTDERFLRQFRQAPAAKSVHHACIGGLMEHTLNVVRSCSVLADLYPHVNRDLLLASAALHDIGKIDEYDWSVSITISDEGHLIGHIVGGAMMVKEAADRIDGFDEMTSFALQHAILSHHGQKEFGSPKRPKSIEAVMLHMADDLDAKVDIFRGAVAESEGNGESGLFTRKNHFLDRPVFKGVIRQVAPEPEIGNGNGDGDADLDLFSVDPDWDPFAEE